MILFMLLSCVQSPECRTDRDCAELYDGAALPRCVDELCGTCRTDADCFSADLECVSSDVGTYCLERE